MVDRLDAALSGIALRDMLLFVQGTLLWYLDWVNARGVGTVTRLEPIFFKKLWLTFPNPILRHRTVQVAVAMEHARKIPPKASVIVKIAEEVAKHMGQRWPLTTADSPLAELIDGLLLSDRPAGLYVLGVCLARVSDRAKKRMRRHVQNRIGGLATKDQSRIKAAIKIGESGTQ